jgi:hypothetical protein
LTFTLSKIVFIVMGVWEREVKTVEEAKAVKKVARHRGRLGPPMVVGVRERSSGDGHGSDVRSNSERSGGRNRPPDSASDLP